MTLAPGQGAQTPGMLAPWLERPGAAEQVAQFSQLAGLDLARLGTTADAEEIKDTAITQPLVVALGLLAAAELELTGADPAQLVIAGHSVGEITAIGVAGVLDHSTAVAVAARRGAEMAAACALTPTGMSALLGGDAETVAAGIEAKGLTPANRNGAGQIVAAGALDGLAALADDPPAGARVRPLAVAGAFHTHFMAPAQTAVGAFAANLSAKDPQYALLSNSDGAAVADGSEVMTRLIAQITRPVRWDLCQQTLRDLRVTAIIELPPAGTLAGLAKRELGGIEIVAVKTPADLAAAQLLIAAHTQPASES